MTAGVATPGSRCPTRRRHAAQLWILRAPGQRDIARPSTIIPRPAALAGAESPSAPTGGALIDKLVRHEPRAGSARHCSVPNHQACNHQLASTRAGDYCAGPGWKSDDDISVNRLATAWAADPRPLARNSTLARIVFVGGYLDGRRI